MTGGGRAVGAAITHQLARSGARITVMGRDEKRVKQSVLELREFAEANFQVVRMESPEAVALAFAQAADLGGPVDILINSAGEMVSRPFADTDVELWQRVLAVDLTSAFLATRAVFADMARRGWGRIVNVTGDAGLHGYAQTVAYCAAKHGVVGMTRALSRELTSVGVTVNAVCHGYGDRGGGSAEAQSGAEGGETTVADPLRNRADSIARTVSWLCGPGSESINGQALTL